MAGVHEIRIPKLGMSVSEVTLAEWLVGDGQAVAPGTPLYVASTDKVDQEITSPVEGTITIIGAVDQTYTVGTLIAEIVGS